MYDRWARESAAELELVSVKDQLARPTLVFTTPRQAKTCISARSRQSALVPGHHDAGLVHGTGAAAARWSGATICAAFPV